MSVNKVILVGNLGRDPELRYTPSGVAVASFPVATSEKFKDRDGNVQEKTEWHQIVVWRQLAEIAAKYLHKGKQIYLEGKIQTRKWQDKSGQDRYSTEIVMEKMQMLGSASDGQQNNGAGQPQQQNNTQAPGNAGGYHGQNTSHGYASNHGQPQQSGPAGYGQQNNAQPGGAPEPHFNPDDSIPF